MLKKLYNIKPGTVNHYLWDTEGERKKFGIDIPQDMKCLNLGCGDDIRDGFVNCDKIKLNGINVLLDLDKSLPFKDDSIDVVVLSQVIAHVKHPLRLKKEIERILKNEGVAEIFSCTCRSEHHHNKGAQYVKVVDAGLEKSILFT